MRSRQVMSWAWFDVRESKFRIVCATFRTLMNKIFSSLATFSSTTWSWSSSSSNLSNAMILKEMTRVQRRKMIDRQLQRISKFESTMIVRLTQFFSLDLCFRLRRVAQMIQNVYMSRDNNLSLILRERRNVFVLQENASIAREIDTINLVTKIAIRIIDIARSKIFSLLLSHIESDLWHLR